MAQKQQLERIKFDQLDFDMLLYNSSRARTVCTEAFQKWCKTPKGQWCCENVENLTFDHTYDYQHLIMIMTIQGEMTPSTRVMYYLKFEK